MYSELYSKALAMTIEFWVHFKKIETFFFKELLWRLRVLRNHAVRETRGTEQEKSMPWRGLGKGERKV